ncbi:aminotransferase class I/II-fold pyridoxal phosphate-dependent enzyme [Ancylothrix sp. C2]|uniref:aminotransferase class I/II-fold pyridoxal phosphate-dependent enzyme n=1 Tax=Ancylothrix sp. D3o TaxID=2953691 RepID=UPI0021BB3A8D|nr:aminotransferase class I/II-fold pyridoxal phosphate-dependent enzyme [Ancylothrix sp. D3o]MCT7949544.1 aminotransferase class I/II-fold pyridoxal phosphate-dependent enzyme [Ancylothrix sp. D3o]
MSSPHNPQTQTPLLEALKKAASQPDTPFYAPGHKRGQATPQPLAELLGKKLFSADLPELPELDNLFAPQTVIQEAQKLAAEAFGASQTWFLANGSTAGIIASILAVCNPNEKIILPRNIHRSVISGLILSGAIPIFINPEYDPTWDLANSITPQALQQALNQHPDTKAVMVVYPTYHGVCGDIKTLVEITHQHGIPILVDEAHGAHFSFHPDLPISAMSAGADLTVQSTHKVLSALTQASMLHIQGNRINTHRLNNALQLVQSTSPNYILLASLDAARQQMALHGQKLLSQTLELAKTARSKLAEIPHLRVLQEPAHPKPGFHSLDPTRLSINVAELGLTGFLADEILREQYKVTAELPTLRQLTFILSIGNTSADINQLIHAFQNIPPSGAVGTPAIYPSLPAGVPALSPRQAFFAETETVPMSEAINRISAELICPYPPGVPVLVPGEPITKQALDYLQQVLANGGTITGCSHPDLEKILVIKA